MESIGAGGGEAHFLFDRPARGMDRAAPDFDGPTPLAPASGPADGSAGVT